MHIYNTRRGILAHHGERNSFHHVHATDWDALARNPDLYDLVRRSFETPPVHAPEPHEILAPIGSQEVWAAGVTYFRSRSARMEESKDTGGGTFYDRVYSATRPELFFKANASRVVGPGAHVRIRADSTWNVPEPELTLLLDPAGEILGYTVGNDMSSRDIEGENPLYLPQAKVYDGSCALGPCVFLAREPLPKSTAISVEILRENAPVFAGATTLAEFKRDPRELAAYLFRELTFPNGAYLMTGTGIVPPDDFTLAAGDCIRITIDGIGTLKNRVGGPAIELKTGIEN